MDPVFTFSFSKCPPFFFPFAFPLTFVALGPSYAYDTQSDSLMCVFPLISLGRHSAKSSSFQVFSHAAVKLNYVSAPRMLRHAFCWIGGLYNTVFLPAFSFLNPVSFMEPNAFSLVQCPVFCGYAS
ncbi:hypothetical protein BDV28DRAFT_142058 [Aspergillus coremiiformis]|uniref:Uncharacterized protein n=1 Tax=Aspergillus coremiiformis TaxID=138285 RepID=A0A5N6YVA6_9EURO|nr:hypothetical protein BDV28DRAFT_142058 [Aspergillus coremiiformis]